MTFDALTRLTRRIEACRVCRDAPLGKPLPHEPRPVVRLSATARILVAGQAPGLRVHESGVPFDDRSGDRLRDWMGIGRDVFHDVGRIAILPMGFCFPGHDSTGGDLPPRRECKAHWHDAIMPGLPRFALTLAIGSYAQAYHFKRAGIIAPPGGVGGAVAGWRAILASARIMPVPHPSWRNTGWLKKNPWFEADLLPVLRAEVASALA